MLARTRFLAHSPLTRSPVAALVTRRHLAQIARIQPGVARPLLLEDYPADQRSQLPVFTISKERGFLPRILVNPDLELTKRHAAIQQLTRSFKDPLEVLPQQFAPLESLLQRMTIRQPDGSKGLLALGLLGETVKRELADGKMAKQVEKAIESNDQVLISSLFRDYCFLTSAYLLEPVDIAFRATGAYVTGRSILPACLAVPLNALALEIGHFPFMEYASSYALQNFKRVGHSVSAPDRLGKMDEWETDNLRIIRSFEDAQGSEAGFILVHVSMVASTGRVVAAVESILEAANARDHAAFNTQMRELYATYVEINQTMETMWSWSRPVDYLKFRTFIFGSGPKKMNAMFPNGVIYEGVSNEPQYFRGESGANDSIIPMADNLLEITAHLPKNELTETLRDFRAYRPSAQREYLSLLEQRASEVGLAKFARANEESLALYILMVDSVREFRDRHWKFTKSYIIKRSDYAIATGGSPILSYLPQNLATVLDVLAESCALLPNTSRLDKELAVKVEACRERATVQKRILTGEVARLRGEVKGVDDKRIVNRGMVGCDGVG